MMIANFNTRGWVSTGSPERIKLSNKLIEALHAENAAEVTRLFPEQEFTLIEIEDENSSEDTECLTAEVDDFPVVVAFTSLEHAESFLATMPELAGENEHVHGFVLPGRELLENTSTDLGLLINAETDEVYVMDPSEVVRVKSEI